MEMAMLEVECRDCAYTTSLRCFVTKEDLIGTEYEGLMDSISEEELCDLERKGKVKDPLERWDGKCPNCGSRNVITF